MPGVRYTKWVRDWKAAKAVTDGTTGGMSLHPASFIRSMNFEAFIEEISWT